MLRLEPLKTSIGDLTARIASLEKAIAAQPAANTAYGDFFKAIERYRSEIDCSVPTVRCQLEMTEKTKACVRNAIAVIDVRVKKAIADRDAKAAEVAQRQAQQVVLEANLAWARRWNDFFSTGLQKQVTKLRDDLKGLNLLADPSKDPCEVWFYLSEMEAILKSNRNGEDGAACYVEDINIATFLDCWSPKCYAAAAQYWIVQFNDADAASTTGKAELTAQTARAAELDKAAADAIANRRTAILAEIKAQDCCGPMSKCP